MFEINGKIKVKLANVPKKMPDGCCSLLVLISDGRNEQLFYTRSKDPKVTETLMSIEKGQEFTLDQAHFESYKDKKNLHRTVLVIDKAHSEPAADVYESDTAEGSMLKKYLNLRKEIAK